MIETQVRPEQPIQLAPPQPAPQASRARFYLFILSILAIVLSGVYIPNIRYDWLNVLPLLGSLYLLYAAIAFEKVCGHIPYVARSLSEVPGARKPFGWFFFSPWFRSLFLLPLLVLALEFGLRCESYHRALLYERQGNLLFTPKPNQDYVEKISLTHSEVNDLGLRGGPVDLQGKNVILCLGDSVTYGFGVDDNQTYPAELQKALDRVAPGKYAVLNAGVDAYPIPFMREKFLYLWNRGVHPSTVIVGYSFNEGGLGHLVDSDDKTKDKFAAAVRFKNRLRSIALYNLIVERWARSSYNKMKKLMVPGTNFKTLSQDDVNVRYEASMQRLVDELNARGVKPIFMLFAGYDARTGHFDVQGPFQVKFAEFAGKHGIPLLRSDQLLAQTPGEDIQKYFQDQCHMKETGTRIVGGDVARYLTDLSRSGNKSSALP